MSCDICKRKRGKASAKPSTPVLPLSPSILDDEPKENGDPPCTRSSTRKSSIQPVVPGLPNSGPSLPILSSDLSQPMISSGPSQPILSLGPSRPMPNVASGVLPVPPMLKAAPTRSRSSSKNKPLGTGFAHGMELYKEIISNSFKSSNYFIANYSSEVRYRDEFDQVLLFTLRERRTL